MRMIMNFREKLFFSDDKNNQITIANSYNETQVERQF